MVYPLKIENNFDNEIYFTYRDEAGKIHHDVVKTFRHYFYSSTVAKNFIDRRLAVKRTVENFGDMRFDAKKYAQTYEADFSPAKRFAMDLFGAQYDVMPQGRHRVAILDIENDYGTRICYDGEYPVTAISIHDSETNKIYTFAWHPDQQWVDRENFIIVFRTEGEMVDAFLKFWQGMKFSVLTGWNIGYDVRYLLSRIEKNFNATNWLYDGLKKISPFGIVRKIKKGVNAGNYVITGINIVDYRMSYIKFASKTLPSTSLDYVANEELHEGKTKYTGNLKLLWQQNPKLYIDYNRNDVLLVKKLDDKLQFIMLMEQLASFGFINIDDCLKFSVIIDNMIVQMAMKAGYVVKSKIFNETKVLEYGEEPEEEEDQITGAYNYEDLQIGYHRWILDMDATSMYPFIMMNLNISPETKDDAGPIVAGNGQHFTNKFRGVVPQILEWVFRERDKYKKLMNEATQRGDEDERLRNKNKQTSVKKVLNSFYGVTASKYFRFYDRQIGEAVTLTGQMIIKHALSMVQKMGYKVITGDSVVGNTKITIGAKKRRETDNYTVADRKKIEDIWFECSSPVVMDGEKEIKELQGVNVLTIKNTTNGFLEVFSPAVRIIRHKTKKRIVRVCCHCGGFEYFVDCTNDHSIMVFDYEKDELVARKPNRIGKKVDMIVEIAPHLDSICYVGDINPGEENELWDEFAGDSEEFYVWSGDDYVYDLTVPGYEMYFANGILVHNTDSVLFTAGADCDIERAKIIGKTVGEAIDNSLTEFCKTNFNIDRQNFHFKQEIIADAGIFVAKKHYIMHKVNNEGVDVDEMEFKGVGVVRNDTPKTCREYLRRIYEDFVRTADIEAVRVEIENYRQYILNAPVEEVSIPTSFSKELRAYVKNVPVHVHGARYWDQHYAEKYGKSFADTDRGRFIYVKITDAAVPQTHVITIPDGVDNFVFQGMVVDYNALLERLYDKKLADLWLVLRVEEQRQWIAAGFTEEEVHETIWNKMNSENPGMWELKKAKYNVIIRKYAKIWWGGYLKLQKIAANPAALKTFIFYVQKRVDLLPGHEAQKPKRRRKPKIAAEVRAETQLDISDLMAEEELQKIVAGAEEHQDEDREEDDHEL